MKKLNKNLAVTCLEQTGAELMVELNDGRVLRLNESADGRAVLAWLFASGSDYRAGDVAQVEQAHVFERNGRSAAYFLGLALWNLQYDGRIA